MSEFDSCWARAAQINGWLTRREGEFLFTAASAVRRGGTIVEIGSFFGRSTVCLGLGSRAGGRARVIAVDPQFGSPKHTHLLRCDDPAPHLRANLAQAGLEPLVTVLQHTSQQAAPLVVGEIDLLFIDGSHEYADVALDYALWFPKLRVGGVVAFHDSWHMQGVRRFSGELLRRGAPLGEPRLIDTITACVKRDAEARHRGFVAGRALRGVAGFLRLTYRGTRLQPVGTGT